MLSFKNVYFIQDACAMIERLFQNWNLVDEKRNSVWVLVDMNV